MSESDKDEVIEELEQSNAKEDLIEKKKKSKRKNINLLNKKLITLIIFNLFILPIIFLLYTIYNNGIRISSYEMSSKSKNLNNLNQLDLKLNHIIKNPNEKPDKRQYSIETIAQFPSGNIIFADWLSIYIYDLNYNIIQKIKVNEIIDQRQYWKTQKRFYKIVIKDDNNFLIYSNEGKLTLYSKTKDKFELKQEFKDIEVVDAIFDSKGRIIACVRNNLIKIFNLDDKGIYQSIKTIQQADAFHLVLFEKKNILFSKEIDSMQFYDTSKDYSLIKTIKERSINDPEKFGDDKVLVYHDNNLKIISLEEKSVIKTIKIGFEAYTIKYYEEKGIILVGGIDKENDKSIVLILNSNNFEIIKTIYDIHGSCVKGIYILDNRLIATFGDDQEEGYPIKIWSLE